ncbi:MAG: hypothetical protein MJK13_16250 [Pseudomonadales bacterium]|nr:hypothetical protein [Pseudomonadales bacterium]
MPVESYHARGGDNHSIGMLSVIKFTITAEIGVGWGNRQIATVATK